MMARMCWRARRGSLGGKLDFAPLLALLGDLLFVGDLLGDYEVSDAVEMVDLMPRFVDHVFHFKNAGE
jgi:hypothetical protein